MTAVVALLLGRGLGRFPEVFGFDDVFQPVPIYHQFDFAIGKAGNLVGRVAEFDAVGGEDEVFGEFGLAVEAAALLLVLVVCLFQLFFQLALLAGPDDVLQAEGLLFAQIDHEVSAAILAVCAAGVFVVRKLEYGGVAALIEEVDLIGLVVVLAECGFFFGGILYDFIQIVLNLLIGLAQLFIVSHGLFFGGIAFV